MNIERMAREDLFALRKDIEQRLQVLEKEQRQAALNAAEAAALAQGYSLDELIAGKGKQSKAKNPAKYRNPETGQLWSGRGRRPAWLSGVHDLSKYEI